MGNNLAGPPGPPGPAGPEGKQGAVRVNDFTQEDINRLLDYMEASGKFKGERGETATADSSEVVIGLSDNSRFTENVSNALARNTILASTIGTNLGNNQTILTEVASKLGESTGFRTRLANDLTTNANYRTQLKGERGDIGSVEAVNTVFKPRTLWCADGDTCTLPVVEGKQKYFPDLQISKNKKEGDAFIESSNRWNVMTEFKPSGDRTMHPLHIVPWGQKTAGNSEQGFGEANAIMTFENDADRTPTDMKKTNVKIKGALEVNATATGNVLTIKGGNKQSTQSPNGATRITEHGIIFGGANNNREVNSAQISAGLHHANSLNIIGMSSNADHHTRKVDIWAEAGLSVHGPLKIGSWTIQDHGAHLIFSKNGEHRFNINEHGHVGVYNHINMPNGWALDTRTDGNWFMVKKDGDNRYFQVNNAGDTHTAHKAHAHHIEVRDHGYINSLRYRNWDWW